MPTTVEAYEQNNGDITLYALQNGNVVWANNYEPSKLELNSAVFDFTQIAFDGVDPLVDAWEGNVGADAYEKDCGDLIAWAENGTLYRNYSNNYSGMFFVSEIYPL